MDIDDLFKSCMCPTVANRIAASDVATFVSCPLGFFVVFFFGHKKTVSGLFTK